LRRKAEKGGLGSGKRAGIKKTIDKNIATGFRFIQLAGEKFVGKKKGNVLG